MEWIPTNTRVPETPEKWYEVKQYLTCSRSGYITTLYWWNGWNCRMNYDGTTDREHEITDIVAWCELPEPYKGVGE